MTITLETAQLIEVLASAASKVGSTDASAELLKRIKELASDGQTIPADIVTSMQVTEDNLRNCQAQLHRLAVIRHSDEHDELTIDERVALQAERDAILAPWFEEA